MTTARIAKDTILTSIEKALGRRLIDSEITIADPPDVAMGEFAFVCFRLAKNESTTPDKLALTLVGKIKPSNLIQRVSAAGPYINFSLKSFTYNVIQDVTVSYGTSRQGKGKKIFFEYSQPNTHKSFHIGHLRGTVHGQALVNCYRSFGYKVVAMNYVGDIGSHINKILLALTQYSNDVELKTITSEKLGSYYVKITKAFKKDTTLEKELENIRKRFEKGDAKLTALWKSTRKQTIDEFEIIYKELGVTFDRWYFESEVDQEGKKVVAKLLKKGIAKKSDGAIIFDLTGENLDIIVGIKSDGTALYLPRDLALAYKKIKDFGVPHKNIIQTDVRQQLYFKQLFTILKKAGFKNEMVNLTYDFVTLPGGAMSSREGNIVVYTELRDELTGRIIEETQSKHPDWSDAKIEKVSKIIAVDTLIFEMLKSDSKKKIIFDKKRALSFDGFTASYLLYTIARMNSIVKKSKKKRKKSDVERLHDIETKLLIKYISTYPEVLEETLTAHNPAHLIQYLYDLSKSFSSFYHKRQIIGSEYESERLAVLRATKQTLENGLALLGIKTLREM